MRQQRGIYFDIGAISSAFHTYNTTCAEHRLRLLLETTANILEWDVGRANKITELAWECGLILDKGRPLTRTVFLRYVMSMVDHQCILVSVRPTQSTKP